MSHKIELLRETILAQSPSDQQKEAIFADELEYLLRAAPGSGKTWTSCRRFIWRGANWAYSCGGLALLSFTNTAIREFQQATIEVGWRNLLSEPNYVGTFDAFVERFILTPFGHLITGAKTRPRLLLTPNPALVGRKQLWVKIDTKDRRGIPVPAWGVVPYFENNKARFRTVKEFGGQQLSDGKTVRALLECGYYTHSQRVYWACLLLKDRPHISKLLARRFPEIIVDEAQDTNVWLLVLLNFLRTHGSKITLVGDPDQCIYEFSMASATSLLDLKSKWSIPEKPLSQSFRCNHPIAGAVRNIGGYAAFSGCGDHLNDFCHPFIFREPCEQFSHSIGEFKRLLEKAGFGDAQAAILCRAKQQLESIRGQSTYSNLRGVTKNLAHACFHRDCRNDHKRAFDLVIGALRSITSDSQIWEMVDEQPDGKAAIAVRIAIWRFVKQPSRLPSVELNATDWIAKIRAELLVLMQQLGLQKIPNLNMIIKKTGLGGDQMLLPLFSSQPLFPAIRQETIHQVKGESIPSVLVLGGARYWDGVVNSIIKGETSEDRRLAYVAMTRARHQLLVGLPATHFDKHVATWKSWGFGVL